MESSVYKNIYDDISVRTQSDIYIGVVGPVRTGKSTFIKRFMDILVIPNIDNAYKRERARDELPQSAGGRTIMTTEPKFIPNEAVEINIGGNSGFKVRMIDCVGYIVNSALGHIENEQPRMVTTPWFEKDIPFCEAAELGTKKVITEHSTIGLLVTTDGSISEIPRADYIEAEQRVVNELKTINKPFVVVLNSTAPGSAETASLAAELTASYKTPVIPVNCAEMSMEDINRIMQTILFEFPVVEISFNLPGWLDTLSDNHWLKSGIYSAITEAVDSARKISDVYASLKPIGECEYLKEVKIAKTDLGNGKINIEAVTHDGLFYKTLSETSGIEIKDEYSLMSLVGELAKTKKKYDKVAYALGEVERAGYGIVSPDIDELTLDEPEIVKQGSRFGVRLRASAPSIHIGRNKRQFRLWKEALYHGRYTSSGIRVSSVYKPPALTIRTRGFWVLWRVNNSISHLIKSYKMLFLNFRHN